jgi:molecular chaperone GrpE
MEENKEIQEETLQENNMDEAAESKVESNQTNSKEADLDKNENTEELKKQIEELKDKYIRLYADFDNHRKRTAREKLDLIQTAGKDVIKDLLPVADDFERAIKALEGKDQHVEALEGIKLIHTKFTQTLAAKGLKAMSSLGQTFDTEMHEAITEIPAPSPELSGKVIDEIEKGYYLNDKIIRYAKVVVGK